MAMLDAVILAGGKSERLRGVVPPYHKPFLVVNGKSLLVAAVDHAKDAGAQRVVIVCTGENALPVWQLVGHIPGVRVVLNSGGVGESTRAGLELCLHDRVLVLMSDNVHTTEDVKAITEHEYAIGVRQELGPNAFRYTRHVGGRWIEGPQDCPYDGPTFVTVWCGPLVLNRMSGLASLIFRERLGPHLDSLFPQSSPPLFVPVSSYDVGVPEVVKAITTQESL